MRLLLPFLPHWNISYLTGQVFENSTEWTRVGEAKLYKCPSAAKMMDLTDTKEEARAEFNISCLQDGVFQELAEWPKCREEVNVVSR